tara:strand:- start:381 stop:941 length:561 start_codon:yes stop_codon:yes gene_type:complete
MALSSPISIASYPPRLSQVALTPQGTPERVVTQKLTQNDSLGSFKQQVYDHIKDSKFYQKYESKLKLVKEFYLSDSFSKLSKNHSESIAYDRMCKTVLIAFLAYAKSLSNIEFNKAKDEVLDIKNADVLTRVSNQDALNEPYYKFILSKLQQNHIVQFRIFDEDGVPDLVVSAIKDVSDIKLTFFR